MPLAPEAGRPFPMPWWLAMALVIGGTTSAVLLSQFVHVGPVLYAIGLDAHLLSLVVGFGAVVVVDVHGLLWLARRRTLRECRRVADAATPLIWLALAGLLASAVTLRPDLDEPLTWIKIGAVLLVGMNGVVASRMSVGSADSLGASRRQHRRLVTVATASQLGWWTAVVIGFVTDARRR